MTDARSAHCPFGRFFFLELHAAERFELSMISTPIVLEILNAYGEVRRGASLPSSCAVVQSSEQMLTASSQLHDATVGKQCLLMVEGLSWKPI